MATNTTNYNLVKPELNDFADIRVINGNMDIIDAQLKRVSDIAITNNDIDYVIEHITSGRSYYDKYKSGKLVQVIYKDRTGVGVTGINVDTLLFLTPFIDEKYLAWVSYEINVLTRYGWQNSALNPTVAGSGSNGTTEPRWGGRTTTSMAVTVDTATDVYAIIVGRWKE